jgi:hypothetical protein
MAQKVIARVIEVVEANFEVDMELFRSKMKEIEAEMKGGRPKKVKASEPISMEDIFKSEGDRMGEEDKASKQYEKDFAKEAKRKALEEKKEALEKKKAEKAEKEAEKLAKKEKMMAEKAEKEAEKLAKKEKMMAEKEAKEAEKLAKKEALEKKKAEKAEKEAAKKAKKEALEKAGKSPSKDKAEIASVLSDCIESIENEMTEEEFEEIYGENSEDSPLELALEVPNSPLLAPTSPAKVGEEIEFFGESPVIVSAGKLSLELPENSPVSSTPTAHEEWLENEQKDHEKKVAAKKEKKEKKDKEAEKAAKEAARAAKEAEKTAAKAAKEAEKEAKKKQKEAEKAAKAAKATKKKDTADPNLFVQSTEEEQEALSKRLTEQIKNAPETQQKTLQKVLEIIKDPAYRLEGDTVIETETGTKFMLRHGMCFYAHCPGKWVEYNNLVGKWDGDFVDLREKLKEGGATTIRFDKVSTSQGTKENVDFYIDYECRLFDDDQDEVGIYHPEEYCVEFTEEEEEEYEEDF